MFLRKLSADRWYPGVVRGARAGALATGLRFASVTGLVAGLPGVAGLAGLPGLAGLADLASPAAAQPLRQTLNQVPSGAEMMVVVPSVSKLTTAMSQFNQDMGLGVPQLNDPMSLLKGMTGMGPGFNEDGAAVLVFDGLSAAMSEGRQPTPTVVLPVTDFDAFAESMGSGGGSVVPMQLLGERGFVKRLNGRFAVFHPQRRGVQAYKPGRAGRAIQEAIGEYAGQYTDSSLVMVVIDMEALAPQLLAQIEGLVGIAKQQLNNAGPVAGASAFIDAYQGGMQALINDTQTLTIGLDMQRGGIGLSLSANFKPGSDMAALLPGLGGRASNNAERMDGLLGESYLLAGAVDLQAVNVEKAMAMLMSLAKGMETNAAFAGLAEILTEALPVYRQVNGMATALYTVPPAALMQGQGMRSATLLSVEDSEDFAEGYRQLMLTMSEGVSQMMNAAMSATGQAASEDQITVKSTYKAAAKTIDGVRVDAFSTQIDASEAVAAQLRANPLTAAGMNSEGYAALVDAKTVLVTTVPDAAFLEGGIAAAKAGNGLGGHAGLMNARQADLPRGAFAEGYWSVGGVLEMVGAFMLGDPNAIPVPADLPPVSVGLGAEGGQVVGRLYLPLSTMRFAKDTALGMFGLPQAPAGGGGGS